MLGTLKHSLKTGLSFGLTSGIITTLGLMVGLHSGTHSKVVVIGGILMIAVADAFSDALGIHVSEESENKHTAGQIWISTLMTFISKLITALTFVLPVLIFSLSTAMVVAVIWGILLLGIFSYSLAKAGNKEPWKVVTEHLTVAVLVVIVAHLIGDWIAANFR